RLGPGAAAAVAGPGARVLGRLRGGERPELGAAPPAQAALSLRKLRPCPPRWRPLRLRHLGRYRPGTAAVDRGPHAGGRPPAPLALLRGPLLRPGPAPAPQGGRGLVRPPRAVRPARRRRAAAISPLRRPDHRRDRPKAEPVRIRRGRGARSRLSPASPGCG